MISIVIMFIMAGLLLGYLLADSIDHIFAQMHTNHLRKEIGLKTRPVKLRK